MQRVSTLELFFDLVFVFTVTQLTAVLTHDLAWESLGQVMVMLALIWWMYAGYAWLTNSISTRGLRQRAILLGGMAGYLVLALAVPGAFHGSGLAFGVGYLIVVAVHASLFIWTASAQSSRAFLGIAPYNLFNAMLVLVGGALGGTAQAVLWTAAARPRVVARRGWATARARAASRSPPPTSSSATAWWSSSPSASRSWPPGSARRGWRSTPSSSLAVVLALLLSAGLWWAYFGADDDEQAERALDRRPGPRASRGSPWRASASRTTSCCSASSSTAAGIKKAIGHAYDPLATAEALVLGGGVALFLAADVGVPAHPRPRPLGAPRRSPRCSPSPPSRWAPRSPPWPSSRRSW